MNTDQCIGTVRIAAGLLQQVTGLLACNRRLRRRGFETRIAGEAQKAIGDADSVLCAYQRRRGGRSERVAGYQGALTTAEE